MAPARCPPYVRSKPRARRRGTWWLGACFGALGLAIVPLTVESRRPTASRSRADDNPPRESASAQSPKSGSDRPSPGAPARLRRAEASREACHLRGVVMDEDGQPESGVEVTARAAIGGTRRHVIRIAIADEEDSESIAQSVSATTDETGAFELAVPPGDYSLTAAADEERVSEVIDPIPLGAGESLDGLSLHLAAALGVAGTVLLPEAGADRAGSTVCARVHPRDSDCLASAETGDDGGFVLTGLPRHPIYLVASNDGREVAVPVAPPSRGVLLRLPPRPRIAGVVRDPSGAIVDGAEVSASSADGHRLGDAVFDEAGHFSIALPSGTGVVIVSAWDSARGGSDPVRLDLEANPSPPEVQLLLRPGQPVEGRVIEAGGAPSTESVVAIERAGLRITTSPDESGRYRFDQVPEGRLHLSASAGPSGPLAELELDVSQGLARRREDGTTVVEAPDLVLPRGRLLRGRVLGASGAPVAGAEIDLLLEDGGFQLGSQVETDVDGRFELPDRYAGAVTLRAWADGQAGEKVRVADDGRDEAFVELRVSPECRVSGVVRDDHGLPVEDAHVSCGGAEKATGPSGRFSIACPERVPAIRVDAGGRAHETAVSLSPDDETYLDLRL